MFLMAYLILTKVAYNEVRRAFNFNITHFAHVVFDTPAVDFLRRDVTMDESDLFESTAKYSK
jgi:hypothetical protein